MNLTQNFTLSELTRSETASRLHINNNPGIIPIQNLQKLCDSILQPLRNAYGKPIFVNSGYRSPTLNKAIGGATNSQHMLGQAADITAKNTTSMEDKRAANKQLFYLILALDLPFDQLINEKNYSWIHVSFGPRNRRQILHL